MASTSTLWQTDYASALRLFISYDSVLSLVISFDYSLLIFDNPSNPSLFCISFGFRNFNDVNGATDYFFFWKVPLDYGPELPLPSFLFFLSS